MRQIFRFDLKLALLLMMDCSILCCVGVEAFQSRPHYGWPQDEMAQYYKSGPKQESSNLLGMIATFALIVPFAFTMVWLTRSMNRPILMGAIGAIVGVVVSFSVDSMVLGVHYLFYYEGGGEYLEDGVFLNLVVFPVVATVVCSPVFAAIGALVGGAFWTSQGIIRQRTRVPHQQSQGD
jgi:hypothetical protein